MADDFRHLEIVLLKDFLISLLSGSKTPTSRRMCWPSGPQWVRSVLGTSIVVHVPRVVDRRGWCYIKSRLQVGMHARGDPAALQTFVPSQHF